jgi:hypothetical protein
MAQAPASDTDELLSQLAASEIDRLLAEADGKPGAPATPPGAEAAAINSIAASTAEALADGPERAALLQAAGFDAPKAPAESTDAASAQPTGDERTALLRAAGFDMSKSATPAKNPEPVDRPVPSYLKPLIWINAPLDGLSPAVRPMLGKAGLLTMVNAIGVLAYLYFTRHH